MDHRSHHDKTTGAPGHAYMQSQPESAPSQPMTAMHQPPSPDNGDHYLVTDDLGVDEPLRWPVSKKISVSLAASGYAFVLLYGATCYTSGINGVAHEFGVSQTKSILPFSLYIWGIIFAPLYSPHVSERIGRNLFYRLATLGLGAFTLGAAYSKTYTQLAVCRFFAGLLGGSNAVQIEGTLADVWPAAFTNTYYPFIACAQYFGAASGAIIGWHVTPTTDWRWTQYTTLMFVLAALFLGMGVPETYRRELVRRKAKTFKQPSPLPPALSGEAFAEMAYYTVLNPVKMLVTDPLVTLITLYLGLNFGVLFSWFILVPVVLQGVAKFTPQQVGSAFGTALGGTVVAAILTITIDQIVVRHKRGSRGKMFMVDIEHRMITVMIGACAMTASLFWIGWTANPNYHPSIPIAGNGVYVMGSAMTVIGFVSYLFDAYTPPGTLSALTMAAVTRVGLAGAIPLCIIPMVMRLNGMWALATFGFISIAFLPFPFIIFIFGKRMRSKSRFANSEWMAAVNAEVAMMPKENSAHRHSQSNQAMSA